MTDTSPDSAPPRPGDADRLAKIRHFVEAYDKHIGRDVEEDGTYIGDEAFLLRKLGAAQSALVEKERALENARNGRNDYCVQYKRVQKELAESRAEVARLTTLLNTPELVDFAAAVQRESAHQRERWGAAHDSEKAPADWFWLIGYLAGKALQSQIVGNTDKALHHIITTAGACGNWHAAMLEAINKQSGRATDDLEQTFYKSFSDWFMQGGCDFWSECGAPEALAKIAVEVARLRSPTATGEDQETVNRLLYNKQWKRLGHSIQARESFWENVRDALAATRAQGVREGIERACDKLLDFANISDPDYLTQRKFQLMIEAIRALSTPEPQEEKHDDGRPPNQA